MTDTERDRCVAFVLDRVERFAAEGDAAVLTDPGVNGAVQRLAGLADLTTDMTARHALGWFFVCRSAAAVPPRAEVDGACAGMLLHPVWVADPGAVPEELADGYAAAPGPRPDPAGADGPGEWSALCAAGVLAADERPDGTGPPRSPATPPGIVDLAGFLRATGRTPADHLVSALAAGELALLATPADSPHHATCLADLAVALDACGEHWGDPAAREAAVLLARRAADLDPDAVVGLHNLGVRHRARHEETHDPHALDLAIGLAREVIARADERHPGHGGFLAALADALRLRIRREGGAPGDHDEVVDLYRRAAPRDPNGPGPAGHNLGSALLHRHTRTGDPADLAEAVTVLEQALDATATTAPRDRSVRASLLSTLGVTLRTRYGRSGDPGDLDAAVARSREALAALPGEPTVRTVSCLVHPALTLRARADRDGGTADLDEAVGLLRRATAVLGPGHPERPVVLDNLGMTLSTRHRRTGDTDDLAGAIEALREAVAATAPGHPELATRLINLGGALMDRHQLTGDTADLREAHACRRRATEVPGHDAAGRAVTFGAAGLAALHLAERTGDPRLADEAVDALDRALALTPADDPLLPQRRINLAIALRARSTVPGHRRDIRRARALAEAALDALPPGSPRRPSCAVLVAEIRLAGLGPWLWPPALEAAIALQREAVMATPADDPARARRLATLGDYQETAHSYLTALADAAATAGPNRLVRAVGRVARRAVGLLPNEAAVTYRSAALAEHGTPADRLAAAWRWGLVRAESGTWGEAVEAFTVAVDQLPALSPRRLARDDQEHLLGGMVGLGAQAAACAVRLGDPARAVRLLEQARGVLLAQTFEADSDLTSLRARDPALADRFTALRDTLDGLTDTDTDARHDAAGAWERLLTGIRTAHPDLRMFRPVGEWDDAELRAVASDGPVVLIVTSAWGSSALVVTPGGVTAVPLPDLTPEAAERRTRDCHAALARLARPRRGRAATVVAARTVRDTLAWLWTAVTGPVLDHLGMAPVAPGAPWPRIWWSPGNALAALPLHAAEDGTVPGALDRVVSSYTPTLRALRHARDRTARRAAQPGPRPRLLVVAVPDAAGLPALPGVEEEAAWLKDLLPATSVITGAAATSTAVEAALPEHAYVHFACHAHADPFRPGAGRLVLTDHATRPLTVHAVSRLRLPSAALAYLSACDTHRTSAELADEAVHIASAFQMAGYPHVVGSLWQLPDTTGARVARAVYADLAAPDGTLATARTAEALHTALRAVRAGAPAAQALWAPLIHVGP
ncbi:CHAT domain-containing protein [Streptomyces sp. RFCAC02]|uniref:CHAT domain-containing protein n=1 Tax=Streptomyces sp. RFCAC02 TaxID=2499143 RepID=UPI001021C27C|nr:CHAT domain-containing protein [Streptomyces sp. RFCAC02]